MANAIRKMEKEANKTITRSTAHREPPLRIVAHTKCHLYICSMRNGISCSHDDRKSTSKSADPDALNLQKPSQALFAFDTIKWLA